LENLTSKNTVGRTTSIWENNIRTDLREIMWKVVDWISLAQDRYQISGSIKTEEFLHCLNINLSRRTVLQGVSE
jgi:hypothetical protein